MKPIICIIYILVIGLLSIILTTYDKSAAKNRRVRIPEKTLLILGLVGGALPMLLTMQLIRHKTQKPQFMICLPLFCILHVAIAVLCGFM